MKTSCIYILLVLCLAFGCQKNDDRAPMEIALQNEPPLSFNLIDIPDKATEVDLTPTLKWESAENPKGNTVTYDIYLDTEVNPSTLYESNIDGTSFELTERLQLLTDYHWKVLAKDADGKTAQSAIHKFTTRYYVLPDEPLVYNAAFSPRFSHASTVFNDRIWVSGGYDGEVRGDVISTADGLIGTFHTNAAVFQERYFHKMLNYDDKLWVIGGRKSGAVYDDVWYSEDGKDWTQSTGMAAFNGRYSFGAAVFDNKMWVIGGTNDNFDPTSDVWYSSDGAIWTPATLSAGFSKRAGHAVVTFNNKLWVIGGWDGKRKNDVWFSSDGINWTEAIAEAPFPARNAHTATIFDNKIWVIGGIGEDQVMELSDVWYSSDGVHWDSAKVSDSFPGRAQHTAKSFKGQLWILGGIGFDTYNDIWILD